MFEEINKKIKERPRLLSVQLFVRLAIFLIFFLGIFAKIHSFKYVLMLLILANFVLGFFTKKRGILMNIVLFALTQPLSVILVEYLVVILGSLLSFIHMLIFAIRFFKGEKAVSKEKSSKRKIRWWLWVIIIVAVVIVLMILVSLLSFGVSR